MTTIEMGEISRLDGEGETVHGMEFGWIRHGWFFFSLFFLHGWPFVRQSRQSDWENVFYVPLDFLRDRASVMVKYIPTRVWALEANLHSPSHQVNRDGVRVP